MKNYETIKRYADININKIPNIIVVLYKTFSAHLFVTSSIHHHILVRFKEACLFCNKIVITNNTEIITSAVIKILFIFNFFKI